MIRIRKSADRGYADHGWLKARHSFSFGTYHDPEHMGFRSLRVINEDRIAAASGFNTHGHRDMEIITYVITGKLEHKDSMTNQAMALLPGEIQHMSAGNGIRHSEINPSNEMELHLLQIWIEPNQQGIKPGYKQKNFAKIAQAGQLQLVVSPDGADGSLKQQQDVRLYVGRPEAGEIQHYQVESGRHSWIQMVSGSLDLDGNLLCSGDGAAISDAQELRLSAQAASEYLLFDLN